MIVRFSLFLFLLGTSLCFSSVLRGFNLSMYSPDTGELTREDFQQMKDIGVTLVRLDFSKNHLLEKVPPYDFNEANFSRLHKYIQWADDIGLKVVIDPHTFPGTILPWTIMGHDQFWFDTRYKDLVVKLWSRIARECSNYGDVIWGYDLVNEPYGRGEQPGQVWDLNELYKEIIQEIRLYDNSHIFILMFHRRDFIDYAKPPAWYGDPLNKIIYSPHMYWPKEFVFQALSEDLGGSNSGKKYPDAEKGWTRAGMAEFLQVYIDFKKQHNVDLFIGEFSCNYQHGACWDKGNPLLKNPVLGGDKWLKDVVSLFEEFGIHWTYHCYEDWEGWDATVPHPRWVLMQKFFDPDGPLHPSTSITFPQDNAIFQPGDIISVSADAWDEDGDIKLVDFFIGDKKIGADSTSPYSIDWTAVNGSHRIWSRATDNSGAYRHSRPVDIAVESHAPAPWKSKDIGKTAAPGSAWQGGDSWTIDAVEDDLYSAGGGFHAVTQTLKGDCEIIVQVESLCGNEATNMAGLIMLDSTDNPAAVFKVGFCGDSHVRVQAAHNGSNTYSVQANNFAYSPGFLKLVRKDALFTSYFSTDGQEWLQLGLPVQIGMPDEIHVGLFAVASKDIFVNKAVFKDFEIKNE